MATRKNLRPLTKQNTRKGKKVQHHHLLLRLETCKCPSKDEKGLARTMVNRIIKDIQMKPLDTPKIYYVSRPHYNEGLTAITPIQTSHIAFHFWSNPDRKILHHPESKCLLEFDLYTCGTLTRRHIERVLHHLTQFGPTHMNLTLLNRNLSLTIDQQVTWNKSEKGWVEWIRQFAK